MKEVHNQKNTIDCLQCKNQESCYKNDCRVMAYASTHNRSESNPLVCFGIKKELIVDEIDH